MNRLFSKSPIRRSFSIRTDRGPFATRDQDMPTGDNNVTVLTKKEAAIERMQLEADREDVLAKNSWKKFDTLMSKVMSTELEKEDEEAILAEAQNVEEEAREAERKRDSLKLHLISMIGEDGGDGGDNSGGNDGDSSGGGGNGGDSSG